MRETILSHMNNVVANVMRGYQSDFTKYDVPAILNADAKDFPMIWQVGELHTFMLQVGLYARTFAEDEWKHWDYINEGMPFNYYFDNINYKNDHYFLITEDNITEITPRQCKEVVRDMMIPAIEKFKAEGGILPKKAKMPVKFPNLSMQNLKEIIKNDVERLGNTLLPILKRFQNYRRTSTNECVEVWYDAKYNEFSFSKICNGKVEMNGGIIFHGTPETGYMQNGSVQLCPSYGWSSHT